MSLLGRSIAAIGAALALLAAVGGLSYLRIRQDENNQGWVEHTHMILEGLDAFQTDLTTTATTQRNYIGVGGANYLAEYRSAVTRLDADSKQLYELTGDNPAQRHALDQMAPPVAARLRILEQQLQSHQRGEKQPAAAAKAQAASLRSANDRIRSILAGMKEAERRLLQARLQTASASGRELKLAIVSGNLAAFLLLLATSLMVYREMTQRRLAEATLRTSEERLRLMISGVKDYAIFLLDPGGYVASWNAGAERLNGFRAEEIVGQHFSRFYVREDVNLNKPLVHMAAALNEDSSENEGWCVCRDGSHFWASTVLTALRDESGRLRGFGRLTRDMTERKRAEREIQFRNAQLEIANRELESFSSCISHDLKAPLRSIDGFSQTLLEDSAGRLDEAVREHLQRVRASAHRMSLLIDDLLRMACIARAEIHREPIDLSALAHSVEEELRDAECKRQVTFVIAPGMQAEGDPRLLRTVLENLLGNAWKFTSRQPTAVIEVGEIATGEGREFFVRDNGAGFDASRADRLFEPFQRLHNAGQFAGTGTGIGLASVQRIIQRHGGAISAESAEGKGATFRFTLPAGQPQPARTESFASVQLPA